MLLPRTERRSSWTKRTGMVCEEKRKKLVVCLSAVCVLLTLRYDVALLYHLEW